MRSLKSASETIFEQQVSDSAAFPSRAIDSAMRVVRRATSGAHHVAGDVNGDPDVVQCTACTTVHSCHATPYVWPI